MTWVAPLRLAAASGPTCLPQHTTRDASTSRHFHFTLPFFNNNTHPSAILFRELLAFSTRHSGFHSFITDNMSTPKRVESPQLPHGDVGRHGPSPLGPNLGVPTRQRSSQGTQTTADMLQRAAVDRPARYQDLYESMGLTPQAQDVMDNFRNDLNRKLAKATDKEQQEATHRVRQTSSATSSMNQQQATVTSVRNTPRVTSHRAVSTSMPEHTPSDTDSDEDMYNDGNQDEAEQPSEHDNRNEKPTPKKPARNTWAAIKPTHLGPLHFPGHDNYLDTDIPVTGTRPCPHPFHPPPN